MQVQAQGYQSPDHAAKVEDSPESGDIPTLLLLRWVGHHNCTLCSPEHTSASTKKSTGEDKEGRILSVVVAQDRGDIQEIAEAADAEGQSEANSVCDTATEEAHNRERGVDSCVGVVAIVGVDLTSSAQAINSIEHARAQEADECDKDNLKLRCGICWDGDGTELEGLVHPWLPSLFGALYCWWRTGVVTRHR